MDKTYAAEADLLADVEAETREVETSRGVVVVRALTRGEATEAKKKSKGDDTDYENRIVAKAMVQPAMNTVKVAAWFAKAPAGDSVKITNAIAELSGMAEGARKSGVSGD